MALASIKCNEFPSLIITKNKGLMPLVVQLLTYTYSLNFDLMIALLHPS